jgi:hypothetical protein
VSNPSSTDPQLDLRATLLRRTLLASWFVDTKLLIEKLKLQLPSQPPPRLVAKRESNEIEVQTAR